MRGRFLTSGRVAEERDNVRDRTFHPAPLRLAKDARPRSTYLYSSRLTSLNQHNTIDVGERDAREDGGVRARFDSRPKRLSTPCALLVLLGDSSIAIAYIFGDSITRSILRRAVFRPQYAPGACRAGCIRTRTGGPAGSGRALFAVCATVRLEGDTRAGVSVLVRFVVEGGGGGGVSTIKITWADTRAAQRRRPGSSVSRFFFLFYSASSPSAVRVPCQRSRLGPGPESPPGPPRLPRHRRVARAQSPARHTIYNSAWYRARKQVRARILPGSSLFRVDSPRVAFGAALRSRAVFYKYPQEPSPRSFAASAFLHLRPRLSSGGLSRTFR